MQWSTEQVNALRRHWNEGLTCGQIAVLLSKEYSEKYTRNSVIGKVHRLHLERRQFRLPPPPVALVVPKAIKKQVVAKPPVIPEVKAPPKYKLRKRNRLGEEYNDNVFFSKVMDEIRRCDIIEIPNKMQCKYIKGDVKSGHAKWCRAPVQGHSSYCEIHKRLVYQGYSEDDAVAV